MNHEINKLGGSKIYDEKLANRPQEERREALGRKIQLYANHFRIKMSPFKVYQYDLSLERINADPKRERDEDLRNKPFVKYARLIKCSIVKTIGSLFFFVFKERCSKSS